MVSVEQNTSSSIIGSLRGREQGADSQIYDVKNDMGNGEYVALWLFTEQAQSVQIDRDVSFTGVIINVEYADWLVPTYGRVWLHPAMIER